MVLLTLLHHEQYPLTKTAGLQIYNPEWFDEAAYMMEELA